jgi:hypothetical protein
LIKEITSAEANEKCGAFEVEGEKPPAFIQLKDVVGVFGV